MKADKLTMALAGMLAGLMAAPVQAADKATLRLDWVYSGYHAVWLYAKDKGVFVRNGIDLDIREGRGSLTTSQTVGNKSDEFGTADGAAMMVLRSKGLKTKMVAGFLRTGPSAIIFPKKLGWKSWKDVHDAKISDSAGGSTIYLFKAVEKAMKLTGNTVVLVAPAAKVSAVLTGKVDATTSYGFLQQPIMEAQGTPAEYFSFADGGVNMPGLAIITSEELIAEKPDLVKRMVASTQEALEIVQAHPEEAIDSLVKLKPSLDRAVHLAVLKAAFPLFHSAASKGKPIGWIPPGDIAHAQDILVEYEQIAKKAPVDDYFTNQFIK